MTPEQINLVQSSFSKVVPIAEAAAQIFYARLFEIAPEVRPLFRADTTEQGKKLMATLAVVVNGLRKPETIIPSAKQLAVRHLDYGVQEDHYVPVGSALIYTLQKGLGDEFTDEVKKAWLAAYTMIAEVMIAAAYGPQQAAVSSSNSDSVVVG
jgi:hemoglobin-like flavoprotein